MMSVSEPRRKSGLVMVRLCRDSAPRNSTPMSGVGGSRDGEHFARIIFNLAGAFEVVSVSNRFKEDIKNRKIFLEHHQTVVPHARAPQIVRGLFWCPSKNI